MDIRARDEAIGDILTGLLPPGRPTCVWCHYMKVRLHMVHRHFWLNLLDHFDPANLVAFRHQQ